MEKRNEKGLLWRRRFEQFERSGLSQAEFCRKQGIALATFTWWKRRLKMRASDRPAFIPVQVKETARTAPGGTWACEIMGSHVRLRLREFPDTAIVAVLARIVAGEV